MFERPHHQKIALVLHALNGPVLQAHHCLFGGGTAMALRYGEYRESVDIDFLVSDLGSYRSLRHALTGPQSMAAITHPDAQPLQQAREMRADQYGIRTTLRVQEQPIKFEIVLEGRITLDAPAPSDTLCGIATLTPLDMATSKLLANSDRCMDDGVFSRDLIDLAMMKPDAVALKAGARKAVDAYGTSIGTILDKAVAHLRDRPHRLDACIWALKIDAPRATVWQRIRDLSARSAKVEGLGQNWR